jgi:hypothetical protein
LHCSKVEWAAITVSTFVFAIAVPIAFTTSGKLVSKLSIVGSFGLLLFQGTKNRLIFEQINLH